MVIKQDARSLDYGSYRVYVGITLGYVEFGDSTALIDSQLENNKDNGMKAGHIFSLLRCLSG